MTKFIQQRQTAILEITGVVKVPKNPNGHFYVAPFLPNQITDQDVRVSTSAIYKPFEEGDIVRCVVKPRSQYKFCATSIMLTSTLTKIEAREEAAARRQIPKIERKYPPEKAADAEQGKSESITASFTVKSYDHDRHIGILEKDGFGEVIVPSKIHTKYGFTAEDFVAGRQMVATVNTDNGQSLATRLSRKTFNVHYGKRPRPER